MIENVQELEIKQLNVVAATLENYAQIGLVFTGTDDAKTFVALTNENVEWLIKALKRAKKLINT